MFFTQFYTLQYSDVLKCAHTMPHVSINKLHKKALEQLLDKLGYAIANLRGRAEIDLFFNDLLNASSSTK